MCGFICWGAEEAFILEGTLSEVSEAVQMLIATGSIHCFKFNITHTCCFHWIKGAVQQFGQTWKCWTAPLKTNFFFFKQTVVITLFHWTHTSTSSYMSQNSSAPCTPVLRGWGFIRCPQVYNRWNKLRKAKIFQQQRNRCSLQSKCSTHTAPLWVFVKDWCIMGFAGMSWSSSGVPYCPICSACSSCSSWFSFWIFSSCRKHRVQVSPAETEQVLLITDQ